VRSGVCVCVCVCECVCVEDGSHESPENNLNLHRTQKHKGEVEESMLLNSVVERERPEPVSSEIVSLCVCVCVCVCVCMCVGVICMFSSGGKEGPVSPGENHQRPLQESKPRPALL